MTKEHLDLNSVENFVISLIAVFFRLLKSHIKASDNNLNYFNLLRKARCLQLQEVQISLKMRLLFWY